MSFQTKREIEKNNNLIIERNCNKIINHIHSVQKHGNFSNIIIDEHLDGILIATEKILSLIGESNSEWVGMDLSNGKIKPVSSLQ